MRIAFLDRSKPDIWPNAPNRFAPLARLMALQGHDVLVSEPWHYASESSPILTSLNRSHAAGPMIDSHVVAHRLKSFQPDLVIAPLRGGIAQGLLMARACGEAFQRTRIALWCDTSTKTLFLKSDDLAFGLAPLISDAMERQSIALADALIQPSDQVPDILAMAAGPEIPRYSASLPTAASIGAKVGPINEFVFVGPLQRSAGISEFVDAIEGLSRKGLMRNRTVTFLGPSRPSARGISKDWIGLRATAWSFQFKVIDESDPIRVRQYICREGKIAVASLETLQGTDISSGGLVLALKPGPAHSDLQERLARALEEGLTAHTTDIPNADASEIWLALMNDLLKKPLKAHVDSPSDGITVCILHHNRLTFLAEALASIPYSHEGQPVEVIVVDNASTTDDIAVNIKKISGDRAMMQVFALKDPVSNAAAYNMALNAARFDTVLFLDDDNVYAPTGTKRLVNALAAGNWDIVVTALDVFDGGRAASAPSAGRLIFLGQAYSAGLFFNAFGDTAMAVRRDRFLSCGGFQDRGYLYPCFDWVTLARAQAAGLRIGALQFPAVRYRRNTARADATANKLDQEGERTFVFEAYEGNFDASLLARLAQKLHLKEL